MTIPSTLLQSVSRETGDKLAVYVDMLLHWQKRINLIGPSTVDDVWQRHISDSLALFRINSRPGRWADLGSGAGFPGLVVAICHAESGLGHVDLVESNNKKAAFLRAVIAETGAPARVHASRIEAVVGTLQTPDFISARALASLDHLFQLTESWLSGSTTAFFHKGRDYEREIETARDRWTFDLVKHPGNSEAESVLLEIGSLRRR